MRFNKSKNNKYIRIGQYFLVTTMVLRASVSWAELNATQSQIDSLIANTCQGFLSTESSPNTQFGTNACDVYFSQGNVEDAIRAISPEQIISMGTMATRISGGQNDLLQSSLADRFRAFRQGGGGSLLSFYGDRGSNGKQYASLGQGTNGGAAGDEAFSRLGFWFKGDTGFGDVDQTFEQNGFKFNNFGFTVGADYRITDSWLTGLAFTYGRSMSDFDRSRGSTNSNAYTGTLYTTLNVTDEFHLDATGTFGGLDYRTTRNIRYTGFASQANGNVGGTQYSFSFGGGYDFSLGQLTLAPYARTDYIGLDVDAFNERGGNGWAMNFGQQRLRSLTSTAGAQVSYAVSLPWAVLVPQLRGEWHHQFMDGQRAVDAVFAGDTTNTTININSQSPDRDFYTFGAEVSGTFAQGISAFLAYDTLLGYRNIDSHKFTVGTRLEF